MPMKKIIFLVSFLIIIPIQSFSIIYPITPKYISLKKNEVNLRYNANIEAPIKYIYQKKGLPILVIDEHGNWKKTRDIDGDEGWIHKSMLSNKKTFINIKKQNLIKYIEKKDLVIAIVNNGVVGKILKCKKNYCLVKIKSYKGWLEKKFLWGLKVN
tara:strand:+ start:636 stop:1103 length:468 start_codon:yes stop_codon:yes gene_type:complete